MLIPHLRRAVLGAATATVLTTASLAAFTPSADAALPAPVFTVGSSSEVSGGTGCDVTPADVDNSADIPVAGGTATSTTDATQQVKATGTSNVVATATEHSSAAGTLTTEGGELRTATIAVSASASFGAVTPSGTCLGDDSDSNPDAGGQLLLSVTHAGWLQVDVSSTTTGNAQVLAQFGWAVDENDVHYAYAVSQNLNDPWSRKIFVKPGFVILYVQTGVNADAIADESGEFTSSSVSATVKATFTPVGTALGAASGDGASYVALPASVDCGTHVATIGVSPKVGKWQATKIAFTVNGAASATLKPKSAGPVALAVPASGDLTVKATITAKKILKKKQKAKLKAKGKKLPKPKTYTVERSYAACG